MLLDHPASGTVGVRDLLRQTKQVVERVENAEPALVVTRQGKTVALLVGIAKSDANRFLAAAAPELLHRYRAAASEQREAVGEELESVASRLGVEPPIFRPRPAKIVGLRELVFEHIRGFLATVCPMRVEWIDYSTEFDELAIDSLDLLELAQALEDDYGVELKGAHFVRVRTVGDLANVVMTLGVGAIFEAEAKRVVHAFALNDDSDRGRAVIDA